MRFLAPRMWGSNEEIWTLKLTSQAFCGPRQKQRISQCRRVDKGRRQRGGKEGTNMDDHSDLLSDLVINLLAKAEAGLSEIGRERDHARVILVELESSLDHRLEHPLGRVLV